MPGGFPSGTHITGSPVLFLALWLAVTSSLSGCASKTGDFGRPSPTASPAYQFIAGHMPDLKALAADMLAPDVDLTEVERDLNRRMWYFRQPIPRWQQPGPTARANAIADAASSDLDNLKTALALFPAMADKDRIRREALAAFPDQPHQQKRQALERMGANAALPPELCLAATRRAQRFRVDLEALVLAAPENEVVLAERRLLALEAEIGAGCAIWIGQGAANPGAVGRPHGNGQHFDPTDLRAPLTRKG